MKAVIEGKRFDTESPRTTLVLADLGPLLSPRESSWWRAGLYRTQSGRWFLAGSGGPMTRFGYGSMQSGRSGGEGIIPISTREAREYLEDAGDRALEVIERYADEFGIEEA